MARLVQAPSGTVTFGSNYSDDVPKNAFQATIDAFENPDIEVAINTIDHLTFQQNITNYLQQPDDLMTWFAGYRLQFFAAQGLVGDISDVWADLTGFSEGFKNACTGEDGKQYMVPFYNYPWAIHYSKSLWEERGYTAPATWDELIALADQMQADGIVPFSLGNSDGWPSMGTFDILNMRINGYDFHVNLMAGEEDWTSDQVKEVFAQWTTLLPYHQEGPNGRTWQEAAQSLKAHETGMMLLGTFVVRAVRRQPRRPRLLPLPGAQRGVRDGLDRRPDRRLHDGRRAGERRGGQGGAALPRHAGGGDRVPHREPGQRRRQQRRRHVRLHRRCR